MLSVPELKLGSIDAISYRQRDQKEFLNTILFKEHFLQEILKPSKFLLIGEKGTGKTSYAVFLENNEYENNRAKVVSLNSTDYQKFIGLKEAGKLQLSSYSDVWRVILLLLLSNAVSILDEKSILNFSRYKSLSAAIDEYYKGAFKPEVDYGLELITNSQKALGLIAKHANASMKSENEETETTTNFQVSLFQLQKKFEDALSPLKLERNLTLFIDGIDIRPDEIKFPKYIECIRGLANATWQLNTEYLANIRDSRGRMKICLLMRPDILDQMALQNLNAKVHDNGVVLNWQTSYDSFSSSSIFHMISGILSKQQPSPSTSRDVWSHYFPYRLPNQRISEKFDDPFIGLLRYSFYRPRDIIQYLKLMQEYVKVSQDEKEHFTEKAFHKCEKDFSDYLLGEVRDYLSFYYGLVDFDEIVGFFALFDGKNSFTWEEFKRSFVRYRRNLLQSKDTTIDELKGTPEEFLQFLYSLNIIGYLEPEEFGGNFVHWCFRDRTPVKLRPKVKTELTYTVHPGLARALLVGRSGTRHPTKKRSS